MLIVLLTYQRTECAIRTIKGVSNYLRCDEPVSWYIADDGSDKAHFDAVFTALGQYDEHVVSWHRGKRLSYGRSANKAITFAREQGHDLTLWLEDDWELREPIDVTHYCRLLHNVTDVGMVRLGYLNPEVNGMTFGHAGHLYWRLDAETSRQQVFTGHPSIRHTRFHWDFLYAEGYAPGITEMDLAFRLRHRSHHPSVVWPVDWPALGYFGHIGAVKTETLP